MNQNRKPTYDSEKYILVYFPNHLLLYSLLYMSWYGVHTMHDTVLIKSQTSCPVTGMNLLRPDYTSFDCLIFDTPITGIWIWGLWIWQVALPWHCLNCFFIQSFNMCSNVLLNILLDSCAKFPVLQLNMHVMHIWCMSKPNHHMHMQRSSSLSFNYTKITTNAPKHPHPTMHPISSDINLKECQKHCLDNEEEVLHSSKRICHILDSRPIL